VLRASFLPFLQVLHFQSGVVKWPVGLVVVKVVKVVLVVRSVGEVHRQ
jgi:hypothetical protein